MTTGLVLEGGAMRGLFTVGVIDELLAHHLTFTGAVGVSAGAAFGVNLKSKQAGRVLRYNLRFAGKPYYASWRSWRHSGNLYAANFCYHILPDQLDPFDKDTFQHNPMEFWSVATDAETGQANYHLLRDGGYADLEWIRASASIPVFAHPVAIQGHFYFDGGCSYSIPIAFAEKHYDRNVVIATQPKSYRKGYNFLWPLGKRLLHSYPALLKQLKKRATNYNHCLAKIAQMEAKGQIFVVRPPFALQIGTLESNKEEIKRVYHVGLVEAQRRLPALVRFLK